MKQLILVTVVIFNLLSCQSNKTPKTEDSLRTQTPSDTQIIINQTERNEPIETAIEEEFEIGEDSFLVDKEYADTKGVLIGDRIYKYGNNTKIMGKLANANGKTIEIIGKTSKIFGPKNNGPNEICDQYPFIQIKVDNEIVWVHGTYVFKIEEQALPNITNAEYDLVLCHDFGIGAANEEGLTGCEDFSPVLLREKKTNRYKILKLVNEITEKENFHDNFNYYNLISDEGMGEQIKSCLSSPKDLKLKVMVSFQEFGADYDLVINEIDTEIPIATISNYREISE